MNEKMDMEMVHKGKLGCHFLLEKLSNNLFKICHSTNNTINCVILVNISNNKEQKSGCYKKKRKQKS